MPLLEQEEQDWLLEALAGLVERRGAAPLLENPLLEPSGRFFPDAWEPSERGVRVLAKRLLLYAGLGHLDAEVGTFSQPDEVRELDAYGRPAAWGHEGAAAWFAGIEQGRCLFGVAVENLEDPEAVVATMAHEVAHAYRRYHDLEVEDRLDEERLTDVTTIYLGFGILTTNGAYRYRASGELVGGSTITRWSHSRAGYLPPEAMAFLLAAQVEARGMGIFQRGRLTGLLETNQASYFGRARRLLRRNATVTALRASASRRPGRGPAAPRSVRMQLEGKAPESSAPQGWNEDRKVYRVRRSMALPYAFRGGLLGVLVPFVLLVLARALGFLDQVPLGLAFTLPLGCFVAGLIWGTRVPWDYCSDPSCAAGLVRGARSCPRCGGSIAGEIDSPRKRPLDDDMPAAD